MPRYDYRCRMGHVVTCFRSFAERLTPEPCPVCGRSAEYQFPLTSRQADGIYSYSPNFGSARDHERRMDALESGKRIIDRKPED